MYSYKKAYPNETETETCVRYARAAIPASLKPSLGMIPGFNEATSEEAFKKAIKQFDTSRRGTIDNKQNDRVVTSELATILKDLVTGIRKEGEATRNAIVTALREDNRHQSIEPRRGYSPIRQSFASPSRDGRHQSPNYRVNRTSSPGNHGYNNRNNVHQDPRTDNREVEQELPKSENENDQAFSSDKYFKKFGKPPSPCIHCNDWHWVRHCPQHLN